MKGQIIQSVFKLMLGTSALLVSVSFFIRTISPVQASNLDNPITPEISMPIPNGTTVGCGSGIYEYVAEYSSWDGKHPAKWKKVGP
jgi:hypothetical protein